MWFAIVGKRTVQGTTARTRSPDAKPSPSRQQRLVVSETERDGELGPLAASPARRIPVRDLAASLRVERRLPQLGEEEAVVELLERAELGQHLGLLAPDELGLRNLPRARNPPRGRARRPCPARERSRCSAMSRSNSSSSTGSPRSRASSRVSSSGKPYVSWSRKASSPADPVRAALEHLFEEPHPGRERLAEALLLRARARAWISARCSWSSG